MTLSDTDEAVARLVVDRLLDGDEDPLLRLSVRASAVALDRWGRDLDRGAGEQRFAAFGEAVARTVEDVLDHYGDEDVHVEGVDGLVFEGRVVDVETLTASTHEVTDTIEAGGGFDRDTPGGLVEEVPEA